MTELDVTVSGERLAWLVANAKAVCDPDHEARRCLRLAAGGAVGSAALEATATDLRAFGVFTATANVAGAGAAMVPADTLARAVATLKSRLSVRVWVEGPTLFVGSRSNAGKARTLSFGTFPLDRFTELPPAPDAAWRALPPGVLSEMMRFCRHAAADPVAWPQLAGLRVEARGGLLTVAALDGTRAAFAAAPTDAADFATTIPMRVVAEVLTTFVDDDAVACEIAEHGRDVWLRRPDRSVVLAARKLATGFPENWRSLLEDHPAGPTPHRAAVDRAELAEAVRALSGVEGRDDTRAALIAWGADELTITAEGSEAGGGSDVVAIGRLDTGPEPAEQVVSLRKLEQALAAHKESPTVALRAGGRTAPLWVESGPGAPSYRRCLIMPMNRP